MQAFMALSEAALGSWEGGPFLEEMTHPRGRLESRLRATRSCLAVCSWFLRGNSQSRNRVLLPLQRQNVWKDMEIY